jgi:tellurium resistance protein TerD
MLDMVKGERRVLNITQQGNRRVVVGLRWDLTPAKSLLACIQKFFSGSELYYDLDLVCFLFDQDGVYIGVISGKTDRTLEHSAGIYHSGDDQDGKGDGDDEQISAELTHVPSHVHHVIFKAAVAEGECFASVRSASLRCADGYSGFPFLKINLVERRGAKKAAYVMAELYRNPAAPEQWMIHFIDEYFTRAKTIKWKLRLTKYLSRAKGD